MIYSESPFSQLSDELCHVFWGHRRFPTTRAYIMVTKCSKWYLQMSETLSMPIHRLCLRLASIFCSLMSPSPKSRTFRLGPDLWCHRLHLGQISHHFWKVRVQGYRVALEFWKSVQQFGTSQGGGGHGPTPTGRDSPDPYESRVNDGSNFSLWMSLKRTVIWLINKMDCVWAHLWG